MMKLPSTTEESHYGKLGSTLICFPQLFPLFPGAIYAFIAEDLEARLRLNRLIEKQKQLMIASTAASLLVGVTLQLPIMSMTVCFALAQLWCSLEIRRETKHLNRVHFRESIHVFVDKVGEQQIWGHLWMFTFMVAMTFVFASVEMWGFILLMIPDVAVAIYALKMA